MPLAFFEAEVERVRMHVASYADVTSGVSFALGEPASLPRIVCLLLVISGVVGLKVFH